MLTTPPTHRPPHASSAVGCLETVDGGLHPFLMWVLGVSRRSSLGDLWFDLPWTRQLLFVWLVLFCVVPAVVDLGRLVY